jgi:DNA-binding XRE family transcriptional regulator
MEFDIAALRQNIEQFCAEREITVNALSESIGVRNSTINAILKGRSNNPSIQLLVSIAAFFNITVDDLINKRAPVDQQSTMPLDSLKRSIADN